MSKRGRVLCCHLCRTQTLEQPLVGKQFYSHFIVQKGSLARWALQFRADILWRGRTRGFFFVYFLRKGWRGEAEWQHDYAGCRFQLEMWGALAEIAAHHVKKGERIFVTGRIEVKSWVKETLRTMLPSSHHRFIALDGQVAVRNICYVEAYSDQSPAYGQSIVAQQEDYVQMGSSNRSQDATTMGSSQRNWNQQQLASQPSQGRLVQRGSSKNNDEEALATERKWQEYFADPTQWWDNREKKRNPKAPDFKHKSTQEALWINSWNNPP